MNNIFCNIEGPIQNGVWILKDSSKHSPPWKPSRGGVEGQQREEECKK